VLVHASEQRGFFLGRDAAGLLATWGVSKAGCSVSMAWGGAEE
jgi:hypothetical protein